MQIKGERQRQIGIKVPFMRFVEKNRGDAFQAGIGLQAPHQQAFGDNLNPCAVGKLAVQARGKADGAAGLVFTDQRRHAARGGARGDPARLQNQDAPMGRPGFFHQCQRHNRGLARAGWRDQYSVGRSAKGSAQRRQRFGNGQFGEHGWGRLSRYPYPCDAPAARNQAASVSAAQALGVAASGQAPAPA